MVSDSSFIAKLPSAISKAHPALGTTANSSEEIWSRILQDVSSKSSNITQGSVIFLGNENSGKSSLIFRMTNGERQNYSSVLEYNYLVVHADPDDSYAYQLGSGTGLGPADSANLPLWTLDGKEELAPLLRFTFPSQLAKCAVVLCVSLEQPGNILPTLQRWYSVIEDQVRAFYSPEEIEQACQMQMRFWQEYIEPVESSLHMESASRLEIDPVLLPPEAGVLEKSCGAMIVVAITKSDLHTDLGADANKVQYHVRQFCLEHGAALVYTSAKEEKNTKLLYKYLAHRVFSLPFTHPAYIVENDSIFIPSGWDSEQKLSIIRETIIDPEVLIFPQDNYQQSGVLSARSVNSDQAIETEDEQAFLQRLHSALQENVTIGIPTGGITPKRSSELPSSVGAVPTLATSSSAGKNLAAQAANGADSTTLASFFNSLLKKDTGTPAVKSANLTNDPAAHFQKMLGKPQATSTLTSKSSSATAPEAKLIEPQLQQEQPQLVTATAAADGETTESDISSAGSARTPCDAETPSSSNIL